MNLKEPPAGLPTPNIILFGETGSGKSSIINLLADRTVAHTASSARGCTFEHECHQITIFDSTFNIYDTAGLNEGDTGRVPTKDAIVQLYSLLQNLNAGVNLLIFCMRGPRLKSVARENWKFFHRIVCQRKVPIVLAVTGLENEDEMRYWWPANKGAFQRDRIFPNGVACITTIKGKDNAFEAEYQESRVTMYWVLRDCALEEPWKVPHVQWFGTIANATIKTSWCRRIHQSTEIQQVVGPGIQAIMDIFNMSEDDAKLLGDSLSKVTAPPAYTSPQEPE